MGPNHSSNNNKNIKFIGQVQEAISFKIDPKAASASESALSSERRIRVFISSIFRERLLHCSIF